MAEPVEKAPGEVRHSGQAVVRLVLFAVVILSLAGLAWALVRVATRPATPDPTSLHVPALGTLPPPERWRG